MDQRDINRLIQQGMFQYGSSIPVAEVARMFGVPVPVGEQLNMYDVMIKYDLQMLTIYDQINKALMPIGRKLVRQGDDYHVPTIENTLLHVDRYEDKASRASAKARTLRTGFWSVNPDYVNEDDRTRAARAHFRDMQNRRRRNGGEAL